MNSACYEDVFELNGPFHMLILIFIEWRPLLYLSYQELREDVFQLAQLLVHSHPDPYSTDGGAVAFHRRVAEIAEALPEDGLTERQFLKRLRPLVASLKDGHTTLYSLEDETTSTKRSWLEWEAVEEQLVLMKVYRPEDRPFLGARLARIEGVPFAELVRRVDQVRGCDNLYHQLISLASVFRQPSLLTELLEREQMPPAIQLTLLMPDGKEREVEIPLSENQPGEAIVPESSVTRLPTLNAAQLGWSFLDEQRQVAYLSATSAMHYREAFEFSHATGYKMHLDAHLDTTARKVVQGPLPESVEEKIAAIPSATNLLMELFTAMYEARSVHLIVDLRQCLGGNSLLGSMLIYFLYGVESLIEVVGGYQIKRYSPLYFENYQQASPEQFQEALHNGGYDFTDERTWQRIQQKGLAAEDRQRAYEEYQHYFSWTPTFAQIVEQRRGEKLWTPEVTVLTSAETFSAGFDVAVDLWQRGARIVGVPSGQAGNCFIDVLKYQLKHSGLKGGLSFKRSLRFPTDPEQGKLLRPVRELTYAYLASRHFDPHATLRLALESLSHEQGR